MPRLHPFQYEGHDNTASIYEAIDSIDSARLDVLLKTAPAEVHASGSLLYILTADVSHRTLLREYNNAVGGTWSDIYPNYMDPRPTSQALQTEAVSIVDKLAAFGLKALE